LSEPDETQINQLVTPFVAFYQDAVLHSVPSGTTLNHVNITPLDGTSGAFSFVPALAGDGGPNPTSAQTCEVLTIRTALRGRQNRGRVYLPAFVEEDWDSLGHIASTAVTRVIGAAAALDAAVDVNGWQIGVGSYGPYKNPITHVLEVGTPHFTPATSFTMDQLADVQRSRKS
jgi:hypothetical protein